MKKTFYISFVLLMFFALSPATQAQNDPKKLKMNRLSLSVLDMAFGEVGFQYERLLGNGQAGIFVPMNIGFFEGGFYDYDNNFYTGLGVNYYPTGQGGWKYYCGLELNAGYGTFYHSYDYYDPFHGYYHWYEEAIDGVYTRFLINNGVMYSPTTTFCVDLRLGLGFRNAFVEELTKDEKINPNATFKINLSYRF
ncbi:MAG: hypothetical protein AB9842_11085 [Bacteroidales bacterium]